MSVYLGWRIALTATLPIVCVVAFLTYAHSREARQEFTRELEQSIFAAGNQVDDYLNSHVAAIEALAGFVTLAPAFDAAQLAPRLENIRRHHPGFLTLIAADRDGWLVATEPAVDQTGEPVLRESHNVRDRAYFSVPMSSGESFLSDVFMGRGFGNDPIVAISAPVFTGGEIPAGIVEGSLDLSDLHRFDPFARNDPDEYLVILDQHSRVIYASHPQRFPALKSLAASSGLAALQETSPGKSLFVSAETDSVDDRPCFLARYVTTQGWQVIGVRHHSPLTGSTLTRWLISGGLVLSALLLALALALAVTEQVTKPLRRLAASLEHFVPGRSADLPAAAPDAPEEISLLFGEFHAMATRLDDGFVKLNRSLDESHQLREMLEDVVNNREEIIAKRTAALNERTEALRRANEALERLASEDGLTGLANRRTFDDFLRRSWRAARRDRVPLALILFDIDHFKAYNDHYGHQAGDEVLRRIGQLLRDSFGRPMDLVARYGGEEFVVVLGNTSAAQAGELAESLRCRIEDLAIVHGRGGARSTVTASFGVAAVVPLREETPDQLLSLADHALYRAKANGRNTCEVAPERDPHDSVQPPRALASGVAAGTAKRRPR